MRASSIYDCFGNFLIKVKEVSRNTGKYSLNMFYSCLKHEIEKTVPNELQIAGVAKAIFTVTCISSKKTASKVLTAL